MRTAPRPAPILLVGCVLLCTAGAARALGFGRVVNVSQLGQPLNFAAAVRLESDESLARECVSAEVMAGDVRLPPAAVRLTLEPGADAAERTLRITTTAPIEEPVVTVTLSAGCNGRLTRSFVTLVDPPGVNLAQAGSVAPVTLPPQRVESQVAPVVTVVEAANAASAPPVRPPAASRPAVATRAQRPRVVADEAPLAAPPRRAADEPRPRSRPATPATVATRRTGPRLQLDPSPVALAASGPKAPEVAVAVSGAASAALLEAAQAAAAAASAASAAEAAQRRVMDMERNIARLREESEATQKALATLQASLEQAKTQRYTNPLVYLLAGLSALLAGLVGFLWWRQSRSRPASQWWLAPTGAAAAAPAPAPRRAELPVAATPRTETQPAVMDDRALLRRELENPATLPHPTLVPPTVLPPIDPPPPPAAPAAAPAATRVEPAGVRRELSVEELIDLEQQADFFVVLGQDEAAIDLLMGHVRSSGGVSPLPYLKLLEIYHRRGEHEAYERIRDRFNVRFNTYAPEWGHDLSQGKSLEDYPAAIEQLQRLWGEPARVTQSLDAALLREDENPDSFDLPAYRELLFLYSIARDLAEHPGSAGAVDLLLPLDGEEPEQPIEKLSASRLHGFAATDQLNPAVDLDVTMALPEPLPSRDDGPSSFLGLVNVRPKDGAGSSY